MEQIETQASDLRFLAQAPVALSDTASVTYDTPQPRPHASPGSATFGDNSALEGDSVFNANKRKSVDDGSGGTKQTRSKRNRVSDTLLLSRYVLWHALVAFALGFSAPSVHFICVARCGLLDQAY